MNSSRVSSLISEPCSMQSKPASIAARMPSSPWACAATLSPARCASSAIAASSSFGVLLSARGAGVRHHAARRAHLDDLGAVLDLVADRLAHLADAVRDALLDGERHDVRGERLEHRRVEVPAGRRDGVPGGHHAGAVDPPEVDRLLQRDVEQDPAGLHEQAEVANRREPGAQRPAGVGDRAQRAHRRVVLHRVERALRGWGRRAGG